MTTEKYINPNLAFLILVVAIGIPPLAYCFLSYKVLATLTVVSMVTSCIFGIGNAWVDPDDPDTPRFWIEYRYYLIGWSLFYAMVFYSMAELDYLFKAF